mmetsp:Transcript_31839/g.38526  ORF Transcript_31839/g.38526 Transcript_31839/m.38526 type:complete len:301 (+) Transcript_31839:135-1037(+)|eukprot:CAMPEP_0197855222 /NCGR_PEP_ID=MMETSP1438-20131217/26197_1 /TAXON_ID=1461541 /ORGANISM="Pterosperma sp., Strain CCMP1384" /LENGTH=300 /DNA_ID=CAMNT_0043470249 /DNA_START=132 /DNA_END=1034 /DNA_ORIENTATION=+
MALAVTGTIARQAVLVFTAGYGVLMFTENKELVSDAIAEITSVLVRTVSGARTSGTGGQGGDLTVNQLTLQVDRLSDEVRRLAARGITVVHSGEGGGRASSLIVPGAVGLGAAAYCKWKGYSLSDLMYVTKSGLKSGLTSVSATITKVKNELNARIEEVSVRLNDNLEYSRRIEGKVDGAQKQLEDVSDRLENNSDKLDFAVGGIGLLCNTLSDVIEQIQPNTGRGNQLRNFVGHLPPNAAVKALPINGDIGFKAVPALDAPTEATPGTMHRNLSGFRSSIHRPGDIFSQLSSSNSNNDN